MPLGDHIEDLRRRIVLSLAGLVPLLVLAFAFGQPLIEVLMLPVRSSLRDRGLPPTLQVTGPMEAFGSYLRVALAATVVAGLPWLLYQGWRFVAPGLYAAERRFVYVLAPLSVLLTIASVVFVYFVMLPVVLTFFIGFGQSLGGQSPGLAADLQAGAFPTLPVLRGDPPDPEPGLAWVNLRLYELRVAIPAAPAAAQAADGAPPPVRVLGVPLSLVSGLSQQFRVAEYIKLMFQLTLGLSVAFQTPVVVLLLGWAGLIEPATMGRFRRHAMLASLLLGAILTPADPISMLVLALPLYLLYELGLLLCRLLPAHRVARGLGRGDDRDGGGA